MHPFCSTLRGIKWFKQQQEQYSCFFNFLIFYFTCIQYKQKRETPHPKNNYFISDIGLRSLLITSDSILLQRAAYGFRATACCCANSLPSAAAFSKSALASASWHAKRRKRPLWTSPRRAVRPVPPLREMARSRSSSAPGKREEHRKEHPYLEIIYVKNVKMWVYNPRCTISSLCTAAELFYNQVHYKIR